MRPIASFATCSMILSPTPEATRDSTRTVSASLVHRRAEECARGWSVLVDRTVETESSLINYGHRDGRPVVLKVVKRENDEWHSGAFVAAFGGRGFVRAIEHMAGAVLLERLDPGHPLVELATSGRDDEATGILAGVIAAMSPGPAPEGCPTVHDWALAFVRYRESGDTQIPRDLVVHAERVYLELCESQRAPRLLHGDLQHYNVLYDRERGWVAIDPKGVVGELEYELGAAMRNPAEQPALFTDAAVVRSRLRRLCGALGLDFDRALAWTYAQAVLS